jgi:hypothetical protein
LGGKSEPLHLTNCNDTPNVVMQQKVGPDALASAKREKRCIERPAGCLRSEGATASVTQVSTAVRCRYHGRGSGSLGQRSGIMPLYCSEPAAMGACVPAGTTDVCGSANTLQLIGIHRLQCRSVVEHGSDAMIELYTVKQQASCLSHLLAGRPVQ